MPRTDWYYWRIIATGASFTVFGIGGLILGVVVFPLVAVFSTSPAQATRHCRRMVQHSFKLFIGFMRVTGVITWEVNGRELLTQPGQLIVANHPTLIDIVFLISMIPNATCIVKSSLYRNLFTCGPVSWAGYIANDSPEALVDDCVAALNTGASLVIFPEGTRSVKGQPGKFRRGAAYVMLAAGCPLSLVIIRANPPMLAKHEKWYQIPARRPHFSLHIQAATTGIISSSSTPDKPSAREITRQWRNFICSKGR